MKVKLTPKEVLEEQNDEAGCIDAVVLMFVILLLLVLLLSCIKETIYDEPTDKLTQFRRDSTSSSIQGHLGQYKDIDGNWYHTVDVGNQTWFVENLQTTHYNDGTPIEQIIINQEWVWNNKLPAYCWYFNIVNKKGQNGVLYNWYAINTSKLCPTNWHVSTDNDWKEFELFMGVEKSRVDLIGWRGDETMTKQIKKVGYWDDYYEFDANYNLEILPTGFRNNITGDFADFNQGAYIWTATSYGTDEAYSRSLCVDAIGIYRGITTKAYGMSVRCVKN